MASIVIISACFIAANFPLSVLSMEPRIFGGKPLNPNNHKYLVKLHLLQEKNESHCSGSILSSRWILTAAHCILPNKPIIIHVTHYKDGNKAIIAEIERDFIHPRYIISKDGNILKNDDASHDICLLKTKKKIVLGDNVETIKLIDPAIKVKSATVVGYGFSETGFEPKEGKVKLYNCGNKSAVICSKGSVRVAGGDSGGPVVANGSLVGVTAASCYDFKTNKNCESVYVNIKENYKWIKKIQSSG